MAERARDCGAWWRLRTRADGARVARTHGTRLSRRREKRGHSAELHDSSGGWRLRPGQTRRGSGPGANVVLARASRHAGARWAIEWRRSLNPSRLREPRGARASSRRAYSSTEPPFASMWLAVGRRGQRQHPVTGAASSLSIPAVQLIAASIRVRWLAAFGDVKMLTGQIRRSDSSRAEASRPLDAIRVRCAAVEAFAAMGDAPRAREFARALRHKKRRPLPPLLAVRVALARATAEGRTDSASLSQLRRRGSGDPDAAPKDRQPQSVSEVCDAGGWALQGPRVSQDGDDPARALLQVASLLRTRLSAAVVSIASPGDDAGGRERARRSERATCSPLAGE